MVAACTADSIATKPHVSCLGKLSQSSLTWLLVSLGYIVRYRSMETITPDFLKSSSRGGPRVPRPLLLVKVTAAAAARAASLATRPKFTRYSFLHSRLSKKDIRTPLFGPPFFRLSASTRGRATNSFVACSDTLLARGFPAFARCARRSPRLLAHNSLVYSHVRTERCCLVLHRSP